MPDDKLQQLLLNRPVQVSGDVQYPKPGDPGVVDDKAMRALGTAVGIDDQQPGDAASAFGAALGAVSLIPPAMARVRGQQIIDYMRKANTPEHIVEAAQFVKNKWPRLFGHVGYVNPVISERVKQEYPKAFAATRRLLPKATEVMQEGFPGMRKTSGSFSGIEIDPDAHPNTASAVNSLAHELLHATDNIVRPNAGELQRVAQDLPGGYDVASHEIRARIQGAKAVADYQGYPRGTEIIDHGNVQEPSIIPSTKYLDNRITSLDMPPPESSIGVVGPDPKDKVYEIMRERLLDPTYGMQRQKRALTLADIQKAMREEK